MKLIIVDVAILFGHNNNFQIYFWMRNLKHENNACYYREFTSV